MYRYGTGELLGMNLLWDLYPLPYPWYPHPPVQPLTRTTPPLGSTSLVVVGVSSTGTGVEGIGVGGRCTGKGGRKYTPYHGGPKVATLLTG